MVDVYTSLGPREVRVPSSWADFNWEHPFVFLDNAGRATVREPHTPVSPGNKISSGWQYKAQLSRRSIMARGSEPVSFDEFARMLATLFTSLADHPKLFAAVGTRSVPGYRDDAYICHLDPRSLRAQSCDPINWSEGIQGQRWASGPGACFMVGADWTRMGSDPVQREYDYAHALFDAGRIGQCLTMEARNLGLRTRMTPAVKESFFSELLSLDHELDVLYYLEVGRPREHPGDVRG